MPSSSLSVTSDGTPRMVDVIGATGDGGQIADSAIASQDHHGSLLVGRCKLLKTYVAASYSTGQAASLSRTSEMSRDCGSRA